MEQYPELKNFLSQKDEKKFRVNAKKFFITWPQSDTVTREMVEEKLADNGHLMKYIIAQEEHKGEGVHIHSAVWFADKVSSYNPRIFDVQGKHPCILTIKKGWKRVVNYLTKVSKKKTADDLDKNPIKVNIDNLGEFDMDDYNSFNSAKQNFHAYEFFKFNEIMKKRKELKFPYRFIDGYPFNEYWVNEPNFKEKNRSLWIWGDPNWGKSLFWADLLEESQVFIAGGKRDERWESYRGEKICLFDDVVPTWEEINLGLQPIKYYGMRVPGKPRYNNIFFEFGSCRTFIVINNHPISHYFNFNDNPGIWARFREILVNPHHRYVNNFMPDEDVVPPLVL